MTFFGADTDQLRRHAQQTQTGRTTIDDLFISLTHTVRATHWEGPDADRFLDDWQQVFTIARELTESLEQCCQDLERHAEEQDVASEGQGTSGREGTSPSHPVPYKNPSEDDSLPDPGADNSSREHKLTIEDENGNKLEVELDKNGKGEFEVWGKGSYEFEVKDKNGNSLTLEHSVKDTAQVKVNDDGSVTYTFTSEVTAGAEGSVDLGRFGIEGGYAESIETTYEVTVPPGTTLDQAMRMNPYDPSSIPPGASITIAHDSSATIKGGVEGEIHNVELGISGERTKGLEVNTKVSRAEDGTLSIETGPKEYVNSSTTGKVGMDKIFEFEGTTGVNKSTQYVDHVEFADSDAGNAAYAEAMRTGRMPENASTPGVTDRYTDTITSTSMTSGASIEIAGIYKASTSHESYNDTLIVRDYPDGHQEFAQQIDVHGDASRDRVLITGGTGRETTYQLHFTDTREPAYVSSYDGSVEMKIPAGSNVVVTLTESEAQQMQEHWENYRGKSLGDNPANFTIGMVAKDDNLTTRDALQDLFDSHNYDFSEEAGSKHHRGNQVHDTPEFPGTWEVTPANPRGAGDGAGGGGASSWETPDQTHGAGSGRGGGGTGSW